VAAAEPETRDTVNPVLPAGYSPLPPGMVANVVTSLEMTGRPAPRPARPSADRFTVARWERPGIEPYRALYRRVGSDWLWFSRLFMDEGKLGAILTDPAVEVYRLRQAGAEQDIGLLELDFRQPGQCEIAFFGVVREAIGTGAGRFLMERAIERAWARPIRRLWVHTCSFDHPAALGFYQRSGFRPYAIMIEVHGDPRLTGHLPRDAAPHVPLIER
jgi:GNAT superfamily N-acetyltransferase